MRNDIFHDFFKEAYEKTLDKNHVDIFSMIEIFVEAPWDSGGSLSILISEYTRNPHSPSFSAMPFFSRVFLHPRSTGLVNEQPLQNVDATETSVNLENCLDISLVAKRT